MLLRHFEQHERAAVTQQNLLALQLAIDRTGSYLYKITTHIIRLYHIIKTVTLSHTGLNMRTYIYTNVTLL